MTDPAFVVGNLMGDFVKGQLDERSEVPAEFHNGIRLHRAIDVFSDCHPLFRRSRDRIRPPLRRYAGIIVDVFYDHLLALAWERHCAVPLGDYSRSIYATLQTYYHALPGRMQRSTRYMQTTDLLTSYRDIDSVDRALSGLEKRLKRPPAVHLVSACDDLQRQHADFTRDFTGFFADLVIFVERHPSSRPRP